MYSSKMKMTVLFDPDSHRTDILQRLGRAAFAVQPAHPVCSAYTYTFHLQPDPGFHRSNKHTSSCNRHSHPNLPPTSTNMPTATLTDVPVNTFTPTPLVNAPALRIIILGCNTSIDISHGMGEVTNAYVTLRNNGNVELTNLIATLYALDEGREHPDKIQEIASIPVNYEVTLKMTVDSTYRAESPIQVEVNSDQGLFPREGVGSCRDLGLLVPQPGGLNTPVPESIIYTAKGIIDTWQMKPHHHYGTRSPS
jgi:hypothetical protein